MNKFKENISFITLTLLCCTFLYTCNTSRNTEKILKTNKELQNVVDSLQKNTVTKTEFKKVVELEGYKQSIRNLYHDNAIIRTKERPDDIMQKYNQEIERLSK